MANWRGAGSIPSRKYTCFFCDSLVASAEGYLHTDGKTSIFICPNCSHPTYFCLDPSRRVGQYPSPSFGNRVKGVPDEQLEKLYEEARTCTSANAFTAAVLACRKILMHIAVEEGAEEGKSFKQYVKYLSDKGYIPPGGEGWVDHIRDKGNEANHEIVLMKAEDAEDLLTFIEMLLKFIYEFPNKIKPKTP